MLACCPSRHNQLGADGWELVNEDCGFAHGRGAEVEEWLLVLPPR